MAKQSEHFFRFKFSVSMCDHTKTKSVFCVLWRQWIVSCWYAMHIHLPGQIHTQCCCWHLILLHWGLSSTKPSHPDVWTKPHSLCEWYCKSGLYWACQERFASPQTQQYSSCLVWRPSSCDQTPSGEASSYPAGFSRYFHHWASAHTHSSKRTGQLQVDKLLHVNNFCASASSESREKQTTAKIYQ